MGRHGGHWPELPTPPCEGPGEPLLLEAFQMLVKTRSKPVQHCGPRSARHLALSSLGLGLRGRGQRWGNPAPPGGPALPGRAGSHALLPPVAERSRGFEQEGPYDFGYFKS